MASFTINDIEDSVRTTLLDTDSSAYRYTKREMYIAIRDGLKQLRNIRPEARYVDGSLDDDLLYDVVGGVKTSVAFVVPSTDAECATFGLHCINLEDRWQEALVYYTVYRMYLKDDPDTANNALAANYYAMFERGAQS